MAGSFEPQLRTWLVDASAGEVVSYAALLDMIGDKLPVRALCQPAGAREALVEIVRAAAAGARLTLLDRCLTHSEAGSLGIDITTINRATRSASRFPADAFPCWLKFSENPDFVLELFTSGSTELPRKVAHTLETLGRAVRVADRHAHDVWALTYPATHLAGVQVALQAMLNGNTLVDVTNLRGSDAAEAIDHHGVTHISATPTYYRLLAVGKRKMPLVRAVTLGGEPADQALLAALREMFPNARLRNIYALTEAGTVLESDGDLFEVPDAMADRVRINQGRLFLHRSILGVFRSNSRLNAGSEEQGVDWYDTGDNVDVVADSPLRFRIVGRRNEWLNVGGDKVNPREVEAVLRQHPLVLDAAVTGRPSSVVGSLLEAEVVLRAGSITEMELRTFAGGRLQPFKIPRIIRFVAALNSTSTGKVLRG